MHVHCSLKGTESVISRDSPWKNGNVRFTIWRYPENLYLINNVEDFVFLGLKLFNSGNWSYMLSCSRKVQVTFVEKSQLKIISLKKKYWNLTHTWESGIAIFAWRVTWNYAYSLFNCVNPNNWFYSVYTVHICS